MSLLTYEGARPWARAIKQRVVARQMPPWHIDRSIGQYADDPSLRGSRMLLEAIHLDGRREVLTDATHYEQSWQITYTYKEPHLFPAGTILHVVSWHDNTTKNTHNPDPTAWVGWGSRPDHGRNGTRLDRHRVPDRRAIPGGTGKKEREEEDRDHEQLANTDAPLDLLVSSSYPWRTSRSNRTLQVPLLFPAKKLGGHS